MKLTARTTFEFTLESVDDACIHTEFERVLDIIYELYGLKIEIDGDTIE